MFKNRYLWALIAAVLIFTVQVLGVIIYAYSFIPLVWSDPFLKGVEPERETLFYAIFLGMSVVLMAVSVKWVLPKFSQPDVLRKFKFWLGIEAIWCSLMIFCFFKWTTYRYPFYNVLGYENSTWLQPFFCITCGLALLSKIFFPEIEDLYQKLRTKAGRGSFLERYTILLQIIFVVGVIVLLYVPRPQDVTALSLVWDQWNHLDPFAGWFIRHGWYINYEEIIQILVMMAIAYIIGLFYFIRRWLNSWLLAAIGALLTIKMGMFYYGSSPCIWINPTNTFLTHGWDIFLFFWLWLVSFKYPKKFYAAAALMGSLLVYSWFKSGGYIDALGFDNQPMYAPLRVRQFFPFFMGYFIPLFYIFSLLVLMGKNNPQSVPEKRLPVVLCIYGLMIFVDYLEHPAIGFYGSLMVPAILMMLWWLKQGTSSSSLLVRRGIYAGILLLVAGALLTNRLVLTYPNIIFGYNDRFVQERSYYEHFNAITTSASMIRQLTKEDQKVVVLSNFETALLMQAHRQPLFNNFPVMFSSLNDNPAGLNLKTKKQCLGLIDSVAEENALYVFVDERLWALSPQVLRNSGLNAVLSYLHVHYKEYTHGGFLVVLQRR